jgi:deoxycytidylate deaminase
MIDDDRSALAIAYHAARLSPDPRTQVGAYVLNEVDGSYRGAIGRNYLVRGVSIDWNDSTQKNDYVHHAEEAAIYSACAHGIKTWGATLYCPWSACLRCARAISGAKVQRVVGHRDLMRFSGKVNPKWTATIAKSLQVLANAGVCCDWIDGPVRAGPILHAGFLWNPETLEGTKL